MTESQSLTQRAVIAELQRYFYLISQVEPGIPRLNPDGIYTSETADAVSIFQKEIMGRPDPDGKVDYETWQSLVAHCRQAEDRLRGPVAVSPFRAALKNGELSPGDVCDLVIQVKLMMNTLSLEYLCTEGIPLTPTYDEKLTEAVRGFQLAQGLPDTGVIDRTTWDRLAMAYNKLVTCGE